eukprot:1178176-Prorocentrum_minimum.AAC.1
MKPKDAAAVLCMARPEAAGSVLMKIKGQDMAPILIHTGDSALGVILGSMDVEDVEVSRGIHGQGRGIHGQRRGIRSQGSLLGSMDVEDVEVSRPRVHGY